MKANDFGLSMYQMRLLTCAEIVRNGKETFDLGNWACGSARCAVGDYCLAGVSDLRLEVCENDAGLRPVLGKLTNWKAVCEHFGVTLREAESMFSMFAYPNDGRGVSRAEVAGRIKSFALRLHVDALGKAQALVEAK